MAVHSFSEGIAIGVSFRGSSPPQLGVLVSSTLAVHNIPEGFAVSVPLVSKGVSTLSAMLWSIGTRYLCTHAIDVSLDKRCSPKPRGGRLWEYSAYACGLIFLRSFGSMPQPVMALLAFYFVDTFALIQVSQLLTYRSTSVFACSK